MKIKLSTNREICVKLRFSVIPKVMEKIDELGHKVVTYWDEHQDWVKIYPFYRNAPTKRVSYEGMSRNNFYDAYDKKIGIGIALKRAIEMMKSFKALNDKEAEEIFNAFEDKVASKEVIEATMVKPLKPTEIIKKVDINEMTKNQSKKATEKNVVAKKPTAKKATAKKAKAIAERFGVKAVKGSYYEIHRNEILAKSEAKRTGIYDESKIKKAINADKARAKYRAENNISIETAIVNRKLKRSKKK